MDKDMQQMFQVIINKLDQHDARFDNIDKKFDSIDKKFESIDKKFESIDKKFESIDKKFDSIDKKFESIDKKFESIDKKFESIDKRFERVDEQFRDLRIYMENNIESRIEALFDGYKQVHEKQWEQDKRLTALENDMETVKSELFSIKQKVV